MAYDVTAHTPAGWPYITDSDYLRVTPAYTRELANKLENSDADVAAAINAATQAQAAAAQVPRVAAGITNIQVTEENGTYTPAGSPVGTGTATITFPAGRFTKPPVVVATVVNPDQNFQRVAMLAAAPTTSGATLRLTWEGAYTGWGTDVHWLAIQVD